MLLCNSVNDPKALFARGHLEVSPITNFTIPFAAATNSSLDSHFPGIYSPGPERAKKEPRTDTEGKTMIALIGDLRGVGALVSSVTNTEGKVMFKDRKGPLPLDTISLRERKCRFSLSFV